jgi:putative oxidoreductase
MAVASTACRFLVGEVFLLAGLAKLADRKSFETAMIQYGLLPPRLVRPATQALPLLELGGGGLLLVGLGLVFVSTAVAGALVLFSVAVAANLVRGKSFDCGCRAPGAPRKIGWGLIARNAMLVAMGVLAASEAPPVLALDRLTGAGSSSAVGAGDAIALLVATGLGVFVVTLVPDALTLRRLIVATRSEAT